MRIDLLPTEAWDRLNDDVAAAWGREEGQSLRVHAGLGVGIFETALGLAQIFSHRRAIGIVKGNSPAFDHVLPWFLKETYQIQSAKIEELQTPEAIQTWVASLKKETALVLFAEDHPVTGETWNWDLADQALNDAKIFSIRASHSSFLSIKDPVRPYSARVCSLSENIAVVLLGARMKIPPMVSHRLSWNASDVKGALASRRSEIFDQKAVLDLENQLAQFRFFKDGTSRIFDRAVFSFPDVGGDALLAELTKRWGPAAQAPSEMDTAHLCRWDSVRLYKGWWHQAPTDDQMRGLVTFSPKLLARKDFAKDLISAYEQVKQLQSW
jgi:hypothetical protein